MAIAQQLRTLILDLLRDTGTSQVELARRVGISQKHTSNVLRGRANLRTDLADRMLDALGHHAVVRCRRQDPGRASVD